MVFEVVISSDRTMISNHHGREFLGFMTTSPPIGLPEKVWMWLAAPKPKVDRLGRPVEAPYGLRKVEAKLLEEGFNTAIVDPDHIAKHLDSVLSLPTITLQVSLCESEIRNNVESSSLDHLD